VRRDDEVIAAFEREWAEVGGDAVEVEEPTRRGGGRGFWMVVGALGLASVLLVTQIFANRSLKETIAHAQHSLRLAEAEANVIERGVGPHLSERRRPVDGARRRERVGLADPVGRGRAGARGRLLLHPARGEREDGVRRRR
jgi:hypothetical protein